MTSIPFDDAGCERCRTYWLAGMEGDALHPIATKTFGTERCIAVRHAGSSGRTTPGDTPGR